MTNSRRELGWCLKNRGHLIGATIVALIGAYFLLFGYFQASAVTTVPTKMNFQGRLTDSTGNIMANGTYNMRLKLYSVDTGGTAVWSEDRLVSAGQGVALTNGLFSVQLGTVTPLPASLFASGPLYLEVELPSPATATTASPSWTEGPMSPRNQMATSAYAYNSETLDGLDSSAFGQLSANNTFTGSNVFTGALQGESSLTLGTTSAQGSLVVHDGNGQTGTIVVADTAGSYTYTIPVTTTNDTFCLQTLANCGGAGGGITTVGALDGGTANVNGASISGSTIYLQSASGIYSGLVNTTTQTFAGNKTFSGTLTVSSGATFSGTLVVGTVGDGISFTSNGIALSGTARGQKTVTLIPEYAGATFVGDGTNNTGSLSSDFCSDTLGINTGCGGNVSQDGFNYYEWTTTQATAQDYDIYVRYRIPSDYSSGSLSNLSIWGSTDVSGASNSVVLSLFEDGSATPCATTGNAATVDTDWSSASVASPIGSCTLAANDYITFKVKLSASNSTAYLRAGQISFDYRSTF